MNTETEIIKIHIPRETLAYLRDMTDNNDHSGARAVALRELVRVYDEYAHVVGGPSLADPNPFRPLLAAASELAAEHERAGFVTDPLMTCRAGLWRLAEKVAEHCGPTLALAWKRLNACL